MTSIRNPTPRERFGCLHRAAIAQYLAFSFVPGEGTMLENLFEAEAGHVVRFAIGDNPMVQRLFGRFGLRLWMLLTFEIWCRITIEGEQP